MWGSGPKPCTVNSLNIDPTTMGAITSGRVWTPLKKDFKGKELNNDRASKNPRVNSKNKVTNANFIDLQIDSKKT